MQISHCKNALFLSAPGVGASNSEAACSASPINETLGQYFHGSMPRVQLLAAGTTDLQTHQIDSFQSPESELDQKYDRNPMSCPPDLYKGHIPFNEIALQG